MASKVPVAVESDETEELSINDELISTPDSMDQSEGTAVGVTTDSADTQPGLSQESDIAPVEGLRRLSSRHKYVEDDVPSPLKIDEQIIPPRVNCVEKLILCLDMAEEPGIQPFTLSDGTKHQFYDMLKIAIEKFVKLKNTVSKKHEFALVVLHKKALWVHGFTREPKDFTCILDGLQGSPDFSECEISSLFELIYEKTELPRVDNPCIVPPPYIIRVIVVYNRSNCIPTFDGGREVLDILQRSPYFFTDVLYIHDLPNDNNKCEAAFDMLCSLDDMWQTSYIFEVTRNGTKLHDYMAKLLAHPLQRPHQDLCSYKLQWETGTSEEH